MTSSDTEKKPKKSRLVWVLISVALLAGLVFVFRQPLAGLAFVLTGGSMGMTEAVDNRPLGYFYRFTARYSHKGEPLVFDYVVACNIRVTSYRGGGGRSYDSTYAPKVMMLPTKSGGAVMVRTIRACDGQTTENRRVPEDLFPMAIWFDDVNDMTFGWGYASVAAYESELSQLKFHEARIAPATRADWDAWREASANEFEPIGMITTPWGMTYNEPSFVRDSSNASDFSKRVMARACNGYHRLKIPENIRSEIRALMPQAAERFWAPKPEARVYEILAKGEFPNGKPYKDHVTATSKLSAGTRGLPRAGGNGTLFPDIERKVPHEVYPLLPTSKSLPVEITEILNAYPQKIVFENGLLNGFLACGGNSTYDRYPHSFDPEYAKKEKPLFVDQLRVFGPHRTSDTYPHVFDRDQYVFTLNPAGTLAP